MRKKLIFLDIDGVCNNNIGGRSYLSPNVNEKYGLDEFCLRNLFKIINTTGAKVVFSTNWRRFADDGCWGFDNIVIKNPLPQLKEILDGYWIDSLPKDRHITKSQALELYFEDYGNDIEKYVVLDDDVREGFQHSKFKNHFLLTTMEYGLTEAIADKAIQLLL